MTRVSAVIELDVDNGTPVLRPRGYYSPSETYVYNNEFRDYVLLDVLTSDGRRVTYYFVVRKLFDEVKGVAPVPGDTSSSRRWVESEKAEFIVANSISAEMLQAGAVTADKLQVAGFNFQDNNIWGGAKFGAGEGIGIVSISGDRAFRAYKDTSNYVEMFQRTNEWGMVGRTSSGGELFRLGQKYEEGKWVDSNFIAGWKMSTTGFQNDNFAPPTYRTEGFGSSKKYYVEGGSGSKLFPDGGIMIMPSGTGILPLSSGMMQAGLIKAEGTNAYIMGMEIIAHNTDIHASLGQVTALKLSATNDYPTPYITPRALHVENGEVLIENGDVVMNGVNNYLVGTNVPKAVAWTGTSTRWLSANETMVFVNNGTTKINIILPDPRPLRPGHTIVFIPWQSSGDFGIVPNSAAPGKIVYKGSLYEWALGHSVSGGRTATIYATFVATSGGQYLWVAYAMDQPGIKYGNG